MAVATLTFLTPLGALVALALVVPLTGLVVGRRRVSRARALLRLAVPRNGALRTSAVALAAVPLLVGIAAAQPALRSREGARVRTDAEALFVLDTSRSMAAASTPGSRSRLDRAKAAAVRLRGAIPDVPAGVATLTDRVLPDLFPTPSAAAFDSTVEEGVAVDRPPPQRGSVTATNLAPLAAIGSQGYFSPSARRRLLLVLTDGESTPFSEADLAEALRATPAVSVVLVHVWRRGEQVFAPTGLPESAYRADASSGEILASLATAVHGTAFDEHGLGAAAAALRRAAGSGPTQPRGTAPRTTPLAPYVAAAALLPLLFVLRRRKTA